MRLSEGIVAFEINNHKVKLMHTSENVCLFLGFTKAENEADNLTIEQLIARSDVSTSRKQGLSLSTICLTQLGEQQNHDKANVESSNVVRIAG